MIHFISKKYVFKRAAAAAAWHFDIRRHASAIVNAEHVPGCFITAVVEVWLPGCRVGLGVAVVVYIRGKVNSSCWF